MAEKLKLGVYWAASCGGCEIAILEIAEKVLDVIQVAEFLFWPCVMDFKYADVEAMPDGHMDVCFFNGGIRNTENAHIAKLLRKKSKVLVAFGACATDGGVPGLANLYPFQDALNRAFKESPSVDNPQGIVTTGPVKVPEGTIDLPQMLPSLKTLADVVDVDYFLPGCPPTEKQIWASIQAIATGALPPKGSYIGCGTKSVCDECKRERRQVKIKEFHRPHTYQPEDGWCLLEQGVLCLGSATRSGCEARCIDANLPCRGCYGSPGRTIDQGAAMLSAVGSMLDASDIGDASTILEGCVDPAGTIYRFGVPTSILRRKLADTGAK